VHYSKALSLLAILTIPFAAHAQVVFTGQNSPNGNQPLAMPAWKVDATGGAVVATIEPFGFNGSPSFTNVLSAGPSAGVQTVIGNNKQPGTSQLIGIFAPGQEVVVSMLSQQGDTYFTGGAAALNLDGFNHADVYNVLGGTIVDFEDESASTPSDWNYGDASVFISNTQAVPEPLPCAALGLGVLGLVIRRKRS